MPKKPISEIECIGATHASQLKLAGIRSIEGLLKRCSTVNGRKEVARISGIDEALILRWTNIADLCRVRGIGCEYADLFERAGVDTVKELRLRVAKNLHEKIAAVNDEMKLIRNLPSIRKLNEFVEQAKIMEDVVSYH